MRVCFLLGKSDLFTKSGALSDPKPGGGLVRTWVVWYQRGLTVTMTTMVIVCARLLDVYSLGVVWNS